MRSRSLLYVMALAVACAPAEEQPAAETEGMGTVSLADFAGTWTVNTLPESGDSVLLTYELNATDTPDGWTMTFPGREPLAMTGVMVEGDSMVGQLGPYESALRPGVMVTTQAVTRLEGGMLTGTFVARYATSGADSVLRGRLHGMRKTP